MSQRSCFLMVVVVAGLVGASHAVADPPSFMGLGDLGFNSGGGAFALSGDGNWIVGRAGTEAFRWSEQTGMIGLGHLPNYNISYTAFGVSADGSVIVGQADGQFPILPDAAFRWQDGGMTNLGSLSPNSATSAYGVSADGSKIVGQSYVSYSPPLREAFAWNELTGIHGLGILHEGEGAGSEARAASADGSVVVGTSWYYQDGWVTEAFRWENGQMTGLGFPGKGPFGDAPESSAKDVSADGTVVVGYGRGGDGVSQAWRWTNGVLTGLGTLPGDFASYAVAVSANGSIVLGDSVTYPGDSYHATIWDSANGMRSLKSVLMDTYGLEISGWELQQAIGMSDDGQTMIGIGMNPAGFSEHWIAQIPEPQTMLFLLCVFVLDGRRWRQCGRCAFNHVRGAGGLVSTSA